MIITAMKKLASRRAASVSVMLSSKSLANSGQSFHRYLTTFPFIQVRTNVRLDLQTRSFASKKWSSLNEYGADLNYFMEGRHSSHFSFGDLKNEMDSFVGIKDQYQRSLLHHVASCRRVEFLARAVKLSADINARDKDGKAPSFSFVTLNEAPKSRN